jgi:hypothetical protein
MIGSWDHVERLIAGLQRGPQVVRLVKDFSTLTLMGNSLAI